MIPEIIQGLLILVGSYTIIAILAYKCYRVAYPKKNRKWIEMKTEFSTYYLLIEDNVIKDVVK